MAELIPSLRQYAQERVAASRASILSNLRKLTETPLVLDVALPGAAYFSVAAGGLCDVLHLLGDDVVRTDRFVGASGGACSLFLILANDQRAPDLAATPGLCPSAELLLHSYLEYAESEGSSTAQRSLNAFWQAMVGVSSFWEEKYRALLQEESAWAALRSRGFCAVASRPLRQQIFGTPSCHGIYHAVGDNFIFHNFLHKEEAVQAFVATGEATVKGFSKGIKVLSDTKFSLVPEVSEVLEGKAKSPVSLPSCFCDGGGPANFETFRNPTDSPNTAVRHNALLYYNTWFENASEAAFCTPESIEHLYRRGVDRAILCLLSETLTSPESPDTANAANSGETKSTKDSMVLALTGSVQLRGGSFVNIAASEIREQRV